MNVHDMYLITVQGCGYHSNKQVSHATLISKELYEEHKELIDKFSYTFYELDGKHSETEGNVFVEKVSDIHFSEVVEGMLEGDFIYVLESLEDHLGLSGEIGFLYDFNKEFTNKCESETKTVYFYEGEVI
jgi:hypothetical protein